MNAITKTVKAENVYAGKVAKLIEALKFVKAGISAQETRYYLNSVLFQGDGDGLHVVTTDGHRLHHTLLSKTGTAHGNTRRFLLNRVDLDAILKGFSTKKAQKNAVYTLDLETQTLHVGDKVFSNFDATYPDWQRVVPHNPEHSATVTSEDFEGFLEAATGYRNGAMRIELDPEAKSMSLELRHYRTVKGAGRVTKIKELVEGLADVTKRIEIGFNAHYVRDILKSFGPRVTVPVAIKDSSSPALWGFKGETFVVLMPMRI